MANVKMSFHALFSDETALAHKQAKKVALARDTSSMGLLGLCVLFTCFLLSRLRSFVISRVPSPEAADPVPNQAKAPVRTSLPTRLRR